MIRLPPAIADTYDVMKTVREVTFELGPMQSAWVYDLRSGRFRQTKRFLRDQDGYCCLGVACVTLSEHERCAIPIEWEEEEKDDNTEDVTYTVHVGRPRGGQDVCFSSKILPANARVLLGMRDQTGELREYEPEKQIPGISLAWLNDNGATFAEIADVIEARAADIFYAPA